MSVVVRTNLPDFKRQLREISFDLQVKAMRSAIGAAAKPIKDAAKAASEFEDQSGTLRRAIYGVASKYKKGRGSVYGVVAARSGRRFRQVKRGRGGRARTVNLDAYYWRWVEGGHVIRNRKTGRLRGGDRRKALERERLKGTSGYVKGRWFLRNALRSKEQAAVSKFTERLQQALDRYQAMK